MQITTHSGGHQDLGQEQIITFPQGLSGAGQGKRFRLFPEEGRPGVWRLQATDGADQTASALAPAMFGFGYDLALTDDEEKLLGLVEPEDAVVLVLLRSADEQGAEPLPGYPKLSGDLRGPLIINTRRRLGMQKRVPRFRQTILLRARDP